MVDATHKNGKIGDGGSYCCTSITWGLSEDLRGPPKFYGCIIMFPSTWLYIIRRLYLIFRPTCIFLKHVLVLMEICFASLEKLYLLKIRYMPNSWVMFNYCRWKKSCITLDGWTPINNGIKRLWTGAGFLPSTVGHSQTLWVNMARFFESIAGLGWL